MSPRAALGWLGQLTAWLVILGTAAVLAAAVLVPRVAGATPYTILTGSMRPHLPPGSLVVVRPVPVAQIGVGSVITYQLRSGERDVVTHRVVALGVDAAGGRTFQTRGDANEVADAQWVRPVQVRGERWYSVPYLGYLNNALTGSQRQLAVGLAVTVLLGYAAVMFLGEWRDRRHTARTRGLEVAA